MDEGFRPEVRVFSIPHAQSPGNGN